MPLSNGSGAAVKYEKLYLHEYETGKELYDLLDDYVNYYNTARRHSSIGDGLSPGLVSKREKSELPNPKHN